jgi:hypothetical protein
VKWLFQGIVGNAVFYGANTAANGSRGNLQRHRGHLLSEIFACSTCYNVPLRQTWEKVCEESNGKNVLAMYVP